MGNTHHAASAQEHVRTPIILRSASRLFAGLTLLTQTSMPRRAAAQQNGAATPLRYSRLQVDTGTGCLVIHIRGDRSSDGDIRDQCVRRWADPGLNATGKLKNTFGEMVPVIARAFDVAEESFCSSSTCMTGGLHVRLILTAQSLPALLQVGSAGDPPLDITISSGFVDYTIRPTSYFIDDVYAKRKLSDKTSLLGQWVRAVQTASEKSCDEPVYWLQQPVIPTVDTVRMNAMMVEQISALSMLFAHEFAHIRVPNCGAAAGADEMTIEMACDSVAFVRSFRRKAIEPIAVIAALVALGQWESLRAPRISAYSEAVHGSAGRPIVGDQGGARDWRQRAEQINGLWVRLCNSWGTTSALCSDDDLRRDYVDPMLAVPLPAPCVDGAPNAKKLPEDRNFTLFDSRGHNAPQ